MYNFSSCITSTLTQNSFLSFPLLAFPFLITTSSLYIFIHLISPPAHSAFSSVVRPTRISIPLNHCFPRLVVPILLTTASQYTALYHIISHSFSVRHCLPSLSYVFPLSSFTILSNGTFPLSKRHLTLHNSRSYITFFHSSSPSSLLLICHSSLTINFSLMHFSLSFSH